MQIVLAFSNKLVLVNLQQVFSCISDCRILSWSGCACVWVNLIHTYGPDDQTQYCLAVPTPNYWAIGAHKLNTLAKRRPERDRDPYIIDEFHQQYLTCPPGRLLLKHLALVITHEANTIRVAHVNRMRRRTHHKVPNTTDNIYLLLMNCSSSTPSNRPEIAFRS